MRFQKGHKPSEEVKNKILLAHLGRKRKPLTLEHKAKISISKKGKPNLKMRGSRNPRWKGGITALNAKIRYSLEYKIWRRSVFERDRYECIFGGKSHGNKLQADHIKPFSLFPELRFAIDNGRTLCVECHKKVGTWGVH